SACRSSSPLASAESRILTPTAMRANSYARHAAQPASRSTSPSTLAGMTEIGDSDLSETDEMSLSGHKTPSAKRRYIQRTDVQRMRAARRRRAWVEERKEGGSQNEPRVAVSE